MASVQKRLHEAFLIFEPNENSRAHEIYSIFLRVCSSALGGCPKRRGTGISGSRAWFCKLEAGTPMGGCLAEREWRGGYAGLWGAPRRDHHHQSCLEPHAGDRKSTRLNSSHVRISYAVFCLN